MNKDNAHLYLPYIQALGDGEIIQVRRTGQDWKDIFEGISFWDEPENYRVKPKKPAIIHVYLEPADTESVPAIEITPEVHEALKKAGIEYGDN